MVGQLSRYTLYKYFNEVVVLGKKLVEVVMNKINGIYVNCENM